MSNTFNDSVSDLLWGPLAR